MTSVLASRILMRAIRRLMSSLLFAPGEYQLRACWYAVNFIVLPVIRRISDSLR